MYVIQESFENFQSVKNEKFNGSISDVISLNHKRIVVVGVEGETKKFFLKVYKFNNYWNTSFTLESYGLENATIQGLSFNKLNNKLFIAYNSNTISAFDRNYNRLARTYPDVTNNAELNSIESIACNNNYLYVIDSSKQQIFIFNLNLEYVDKFKIEFKPNQMKANNETICFGLCEIIYFYNIKTKLFTNKFGCKVGKINVINSIFYVFDYQIRKYYIFDTHGALIGEIDANKIFNFDVTEHDGSFTFDGKFLIIALYSTKNVIRLMLGSESDDTDDDYYDDYDDDDDDDDDDELEAQCETSNSL